MIDKTRGRTAGISILWLFFLLFSLDPIGQSQGKVTPPAQPPTGPGSAEGRFTVHESSEGEGAKQYWIFEPEPLSGSAPVAIFFHGWNAAEPDAYRAWIEHLVKRGNIVIYPRYQESATERIPNMTPGAIEALRNALSKLGPRADRSKVAVVGHSLGGVMAFNIAALSKSSGLPEPKVLMAVEPGDTDAAPGLVGRAKLLREGVHYQEIPRTVQALVLVGDEDQTVGDQTAKLLFSSLGHVPCENKNFIVVRSDRHGNPALIADHFAPATAVPATDQTGGGPLRRLLRDRLAPRGAEEPKGQVDSLDYYAYWKLLDALTDSAFYGRNKDYALGGGSNQTYMGRWSDGKPVEPLQVSNDPACGKR